MDIAVKVAIMRFKYHSNMLSVVNVGNQLGLLKDAKADEMNKNHMMQCLDCLKRLGYDLSSIKKEEA